MVSIDIDLNQISDIEGYPKKMIQSGLNKTEQVFIRELMIRSPVDHGLLRQWAEISRTEFSRTVQSPAKYTVFQNYGTTDHMIRPKTKKALHWLGGFNASFASGHVSRDTGFSKGHMVSGIKGKHFVEASMEAAAARIPEFFTINGG